MAVNPDMLHKIMGMPDSPTGKLVALRKTPGEGPLETGVWYSNFNRVKKEADERGLPLVAMWTNGDLCGFCRRFTLNILDPRFTDWMKNSKCLFWLGGSMDELPCDIRQGDGFNWLRGPDGSVSYFPFVGVYKKDAYQFFGSGHDYDQRKNAPDGTQPTLDRIASIMSGTAQAQTQQPQPQAQKRLAIRFNPSWDAAHIQRFQNAMRESGGHCICQANRTNDTMCMCKAFMMQQKPGPCHCGAFEKYVV